MEQLSEYITFDEGFFVLVAFIGFVFLTLKYVWPKISNLLDGRSDAIKEQLNEATRLREEAQATLAAYQKRQREVMDEAEDMLEKAKIQVETMKVDAQSELKDSMNRRLNQAKERILRAEEAAVAQIQSQVADASLNAAQQVIEQMVEEKGDTALIDAAIADTQSIVA